MKTFKKKLILLGSAFSIPFLPLISSLSINYKNTPSEYDDKIASILKKDYVFDKDKTKGDKIVPDSTIAVDSSLVNGDVSLGLDKNYYKEFNINNLKHNKATFILNRLSLIIKYENKALLDKFFKDEFIKFDNGKTLMLYKHTLSELKKIIDGISKVDEEFLSFQTNFIWNVKKVRETKVKSGYLYTLSFPDNDIHQVKFVFEIKKFQENNKYKREYWKYLQSNINSAFLTSEKQIILPTDTGGDLKTPLPANPNAAIKSNRQYLEEYFATKWKTLVEKIKKESFFEQIKKNKFKWELKYKVESNNKISFLLDNKVIADSVEIKFAPTAHYQNLGVFDRLKLKLGKWVDFQNGTTNLVDDVAILDKTDKKSIGQHGNTFYGGRYIVHSPAEIEFYTTKSENEVLMINGKRIDVINGHFKEMLLDNRKNANDSQKEFNGNVKVDENTQMSDSNSHFKNEYKVQLFQYSKPGNLESDLKIIYEKVFVINSRSNQIDFKWYAWDPENNKHQKELIEPYLRNEKGEIIYDDKKNALPNPKYDAMIDPSTGTKKQLVLIDFSKIGKTFEDAYTKDSKEWKYAKLSKLPYNSKFLFVPHNEQEQYQKVIAEAAVINKGGLKQLTGKAENFTLFKLNEETFTFDKVDNSKFYEELNKNTGESSYFSFEGTWLFCSNADNSISNFKLVKIVDVANDPGELLKYNNKFYSEISKYSKGEIVPLWKTEFGVKMMFWLIQNKKKPQEEILKTKYEDVIEYYKEYVNYLFNHSKEEYIIKPAFKKVEDNKYSYEEFKNLFAIELNRNKNLTQEEIEKNDALIASDENKKKVNEFNKLFLGDFEFKEYFNIEYIEMSDRKDGVYIKWRINSLNAAFSQKEEKIFIPIKFKDIDPSINPNDPNKPAKKNINLEINLQYFYDVAKIKEKEEFFITIDDNRKQWFSNLNEEDFNKLFIKYGYDEEEKILKISVSLLKDFWKEYELIPRRNFYVKIDNFFVKDNNFVDIFEGFKLEEINLSGLNDNKKIKEYIFEEINKHTKLVIDKDFTIKNLETVINERINVEELDNKDVASYSNLILESVGNKVGFKIVKVYNFVGKNLTEEYDLDTKKLNDFVINESNFSKIEKIIIDKINEEFKEEHFVYGKEIEIDNIQAGLNKLGLGKGSSFVFEIVGKNKKIINKTNLKVINNADKVVGDDQQTFLYDLSVINLNSLSFKEYKLSVLREKILQNIWNQMKSSYNLTYEVEYKIDINSLNELVRNIGQKSNQELSEKLIIEPVENVSKNKTSIVISNWNKEYVVIDDLEKEVVPSYEPPTQGKGNSKKKVLSKKQAMYIFIPLGVFFGISLGVLGWFIYIRKFAKKVK